MLLTYKVKHNRDLGIELAKARQVAEYAVAHRSKSSADVKQFGLKSVIACQIIRKYVNNKTLKKVRNVNLIIPGQAVMYDAETRRITISCLKMTLNAVHLPTFQKVNQVECDKEYAFIAVTIIETPPMETEKSIGIDRNTTGHVAVVANPNNGEVTKLGKACQHIHKKYRNIRRALQKQGRYKEVKNLRQRESHVVANINHHISREIVNIAVQNTCGIKMEELDGIRNTRKQAQPFRYSLHSWSFYQLQNFVEYKAKLLGVPVVYVDPAFTSQQCSRCGLIGNRNGKEFKCPSCGHVDHADANAAFNIALRPPLSAGSGRLRTARDVRKGRLDTPQEAPA